MPDQDRQSRLPETLQRIADAIGLAGALKLCKAHGGTTIYVQKNPKPTSPLARAIGRDAALTLARELGSGYLLVPIGPLADDHIKRERIVRLLEQGGQSHTSIARALNCHVRTVERVAGSLRDAGNAPTLFNLPLRHFGD